MTFWYITYVNCNAMKTSVLIQYLYGIMGVMDNAKVKQRMEF